MAIRPICWRRLAAALLASLACLAAWADPPGRVGRLAEMQGQVWLYDAETADWVSAERNRPLTNGDRVATDANARAELRIGSMTLVLAAGTEVEMLQVDDDAVRVQLHAGQSALRLRSHEVAREFEWVTAEGRFKPERAGRYRLDRFDATSSISVWSGQLLFEAPDNAATLVAGQRADVTQVFGRTQVALVQATRDAFADEVAAAEQAAERSVSTTRYVSPEMTGAEDLDRHGRWENDAEYGALWVPRAVVPGWAPYRYGHWAWVRPWGWTWVDDAPWGFAPFHYGRWVFVRSNWCWAPGRWVARPVYAPALVAWVGAPVVSVSIHVGPSVGWFPLGPREVFVPPYRVSPHYVRNVNVTHVTNITNVTQIVNSPNTVVQQTNYINRGVAGAVTVVPTTVVSNRQPVAPSRVQLTDPHPGNGADRRKTLAAAQAPVVAAPPLASPLVPPALRPSQPAPRQVAVAPPVALPAARPPTPAAVAPPPVARPPTAAGVLPQPAAQAVPRPPVSTAVAPPPRPPAAPAPPQPPQVQPPQMHSLPVAAASVVPPVVAAPPPARPQPVAPPPAAPRPPQPVPPQRQVPAPPVAAAPVPMPVPPVAAPPGPGGGAVSKPPPAAPLPPQRVAKDEPRENLKAERR